MLNRYLFKKSELVDGEEELTDSNDVVNERFSKCLDFFTWVCPLDLLKQDFICFLAGGCFRDYFSGKTKFKDIDVFFPTKEDFIKGVLFFEKVEGSEKVFENENVVRFKYKNKIFELVQRIFFNSLEETLNTFDFTVAMCGIDKLGLLYDTNFFVDIASKKLVINKITMPLSTLQRVQKYIWKGYSICNGGLLEITKALQTVDLNNPSENTFEFYGDGSPKFMRFD